MVELGIALVALTIMEIVLGIDNIVFIAILTGRLPREQQARARQLGLGAALVTRILLLFSLSWILSLKSTAFELAWLDHLLSALQLQEAAREEITKVSWRDLILLVGGLFLIGNSVVHIHEKVEGTSHSTSVPKPVSFRSVIIQIALIDIIFSLDSVITAVGMVSAEGNGFWVMVAAVVIAVGVMLTFSAAISGFVEKHPTVKILALSFLILIGVMLVAEGIGTPINKGYIYFAMTFALAVEFINARIQRSSEAPVHAAKKTS